MAKRKRTYGYLRETGRYSVTKGGELISFHKKESAAMRKACRIGGSVYESFGPRMPPLKLHLKCGGK